jgi:hypothetical protein
MIIKVITLALPLVGATMVNGVGSVDNGVDGGLNVAVNDAVSDSDVHGVGVAAACPPSPLIISV